MLISFICSNQDLRIPSFILYVKERFQNVIVIDDSAIVGKVKPYSDNLNVPYYSLNKSRWIEAVKNNDLGGGLVLINLDDSMNFNKLDLILKSDFSSLNDINVNLLSTSNSKEIGVNLEKTKSSITQFEDISWVYFSKIGITKFQNNLEINNFNSLSVNKNKPAESENNISRRSLFEFDLNTNPLIYFGIPGLILMISSFLLVMDVVARYDSIDSVSLGTAILTISTTVLGILSIMAAIISYIFGKQTEFILTNYSD